MLPRTRLGAITDDPDVRVVDPGHVYELRQLGSRAAPQLLRFVKRSSGAVEYPEEWTGVQVQEVIRALIDRTEFLDAIMPCAETSSAAWHLRMALFEYEARAHRRKSQKSNRGPNNHDFSERPRGWRDHPYGDVPFNEQEIELCPVGEDGHIIVGSDSTPSLRGGG